MTPSLTAYPAILLQWIRQGAPYRGVTIDYNYQFKDFKGSDLIVFCRNDYNWICRLALIMAVLVSVHINSY